MNSEPRSTHPGDRPRTACVGLEGGGAHQVLGHFHQELYVDRDPGTSIRVGSAHFPWLLVLPAQAGVAGSVAMADVSEHSSAEVAGQLGMTEAELVASQAERRAELASHPLLEVSPSSVARIKAIKAGMAGGLTAEEANRQWCQEPNRVSTA